MLLGAISLSSKLDSNWSLVGKYDLLQESFFLMMASQLHTSIRTTRNELLSPIRPYNIFGSRRASLEEVRKKERPKEARSEELDWLSTISYLYTLSASPMARGALGSPRYLEIFFSLLRMADNKIQLLILRLFKRLFPAQDPSVFPFQKGGNFIDSFLEQIGSIYMLAQEVTQLGHQYSPVEYFISTLIPGNILNARTQTNKVLSSHPYFPFNDYAFALPTCWDKKSARGHVSFSEDQRIVTFHASTSEDDQIGAVRADIPIPEGLRLFYFEIRIDNEGEEGRIGIGLAPADQRIKGMPGWTNGSFGYHGDGIEKKRKLFFSFS